MQNNRNIAIKEEIYGLLYEYNENDINSLLKVKVKLYTKICNIFTHIQIQYNTIHHNDDIQT